MCGEGIAPYELLRVDGLPVGTALQAVCFEARYARDLRAAVRILDMAAYSDLASTAEVVEYASHLRGRTGIPQLRAASAHMEENAWSPAECDTRLVWTIDAELPPLLANRPVFDLRGRHVGTPDLLDDEAGLVIEYDGGMHLEGQQRRVDRDRDDRYRALGLDVVMVMADDHRDATAWRRGFVVLAAEPGSRPSRSGCGRWSHLRGGSAPPR